MLARAPGAHLHVAHVSTRGGIEQIRRARDLGVHVTSEVAPHHLILTDEAVLEFDNQREGRAAPPFCGGSRRVPRRARRWHDRRDATDHAPHALHEKELDFREAPPGMIGFETAVAVVLDLVRAGEIAPLNSCAGCLRIPRESCAWRGVHLPWGRSPTP